MRHTIAALLLCAALPAAAQVRPQPGGGDPRVQSVDYNEEQVVTLQAAPGYQITVELAPDEHIDNVAVGDSGAWQVSANRRGDHLFVKPIQAGVSTNMVVVTDVRNYAFELVPLGGPTPDMAYMVRFRYPSPPGGEGAASEAQAQAAPGRYKVTGDHSLRPSGIDDDGVHTYIEWPAERALPAVYALNDQGKETLVNGMMRDGRLVIDSVQSRLVFRLDHHMARADRVAASKN